MSLGNKTFLQNRPATHGDTADTEMYIWYNMRESEDVRKACLDLQKDRDALNEARKSFTEAAIRMGIERSQLLVILFLFTL
jgi:hypothetical protein